MRADSGENLKILFYIVIAVISLIGSAFRKQKRRAEAEQSRNTDPDSYTEDVPAESPRPYSGNPFEEFIREAMQTEEQTQPVSIEEEPKHKAQERPQEGHAAFIGTEEALLSDNMNEDGFSISEELQQQEENEIYKQEISNHEIGNETPILDDFDAKKAVIYSEILNRRSL